LPRGSATAITLEAMRDARDAGYGTAVLTASAMGHGVYERLGFRVHCRIYVPEFDPRRADGA
jgi:predicted acetyltransferase